MSRIKKCAVLCWSYFLLFSLIAFPQPSFAYSKSESSNLTEKNKIKNPIQHYTPSTTSTTTTLPKAYVSRLSANAYSNTVAAIKNDGSIWLWGPPPQRPLPTKFTGINKAVASAVGGSYLLALKDDFTVAGWGDNHLGQLGDGSRIDRNQPVQAVGLQDVFSISAGSTHSLARKNTGLGNQGKVYAWGTNSNGQLGNGTKKDSLVPIEVKGLKNIIGVSSGYSHSLATDIAGNVWQWGRAYRSNQLDQDIVVPEVVKGVSSVEGLGGGIAAGGNFNNVCFYALKKDGTVWSWGYNNNGQLGDSTLTNRDMPVQVKNLSDIVLLSAGNGFCLALKADGTVWAWGENSSGQLGDGTYENRLSPVQVANLNDVKWLAAGSVFGLALKNDHTIWAWGNNYAGSFGDGTTNSSNVPIMIPAF